MKSLTTFLLVIFLGSTSLWAQSEPTKGSLEFGLVQLVNGKFSYLDVVSDSITLRTGTDSATFWSEFCELSYVTSSTNDLILQIRNVKDSKDGSRPSKKDGFIQVKFKEIKSIEYINVYARPYLFLHY